MRKGQPAALHTDHAPGYVTADAVETDGSVASLASPKRIRVRMTEVGGAPVADGLAGGRRT